MLAIIVTIISATIFAIVVVIIDRCHNIVGFPTAIQPVNKEEPTKPKECSLGLILILRLILRLIFRLVLRLGLKTFK